MFFGDSFSKFWTIYYIFLNLLHQQPVVHAICVVTRIYKILLSNELQLTEIQSLKTIEMFWRRENISPSNGVLL